MFSKNRLPSFEGRAGDGCYLKRFSVYNISLSGSFDYQECHLEPATLSAVEKCVAVKTYVEIGVSKNPLSRKHPKMKTEKHPSKPPFKGWL